jgi:ethanolamine utilization protein EutA (predicted chaperonin)
MKLPFNIVLLLFVVNLSLMAQKNNKGHSIDISGETIEINFPARNKKVEEIKQSEEIKQLENSIQNELKDYTIEMQDQRFISNNVITEVHIDTSNLNGESLLKVTYSYTLLNDTLKFQTDDFGLGRYLIKESNALQVTLAVMKKNIEGKLAKYITPTRENSGNNSRKIVKWMGKSRRWKLLLLKE